MFFRVETENARLHRTISPKKLIREIATNLSRTDNRKTGNLLILIFCIINIHILVKFSQSTDNFLHQDQLQDQDLFLFTETAGRKTLLAVNSLFHARMIAGIPSEWFRAIFVFGDRFYISAAVFQPVKW